MRVSNTFTKLSYKHTMNIFNFEVKKLLIILGIWTYMYFQIQYDDTKLMLGIFSMTQIQIQHVVNFF